MGIRKHGPRPDETGRRAASAAAVAAALLVLAGCATFNTYTTESHALSQPITIDGLTDDWPGELYVVPNERMSIGFQNDGRYLYIAMIIEDSFQRYQVMSQGLTVWLDPKGGIQKSFGIRYPLGLPPGRLPAPRPGAEGEGLTLPNLPDDALSELEILRSEKDPGRRISVVDAKSEGFEIKVVPGTGLLVYEMKILLAPDAEHPLAIGAPPGSVVGIGFETPKYDPSAAPRSSTVGNTGGAGNPPTGGMGGRGSYGGSGGMGGRSGLMGSSEPLKIWAIVQLAPAKGGTPAAASPAAFRAN
jgi:hypothetical protein